jgi:hypothetical protein
MTEQSGPTGPKNDGMEPKLCPFLANTLIIKGENFDGQRLDLAKCLLDKCAMWRIEQIYDGTRGYYMPGKSYCGLAGKP